MDFHRQKLSIIIISFTCSLVDTIPLIVDQRLHSVWELPAKVVNIMESLSKQISLKERTLMNTLVRIALRWAKCVLRFALRAAESPFRPGLHECSKYVVFSIDLAEAESHRFKFRNLNLLQGHQDSTHLEDSRE